jgi:phage terminase large subunit GpA-like protein
MSALPLTLLADARQSYRRGWRRGWAVEPTGSVADWADQRRILTRETSKEPGNWRTERTPYLREPMEAMSEDSPVIAVTMVFGTQLGKTEVLNNTAGYVIEHGLGTLLVVQPTDKMGQRWSRQRLDPMIESCPTLSARIAPARARDSQNSVNLKRYPGGYLVVGHAESPASISSLPARYTLLDEVDSYPLDPDQEGDPVIIAERRSDSFGRRRKNLRVSSPKKLRGRSIIWRLWLQSDQSLYWVPCPHCGAHQALEIEGLLPGGEYLCEHCGRAIAHRHKSDMLAAGAWRAAHPERSQDHRGFRLPTLYAPDGLGPHWADLYTEQLQATGDPIAVKTFVSTRGARAYESTEGKVEPDELRACRETWHLRDIPVGCLPICAAVDCQGNRLELLILGFGRGPTARDPQIYVIDYAVIPGSPIEPATWEALDDYLSRPLRNAYGIEQLPRFVAVDSGNWTQEAYAACHERAAKGWIAVKGASAENAPLHSPPKRHDIDWRGRFLRHGGTHYMVGTHVAKDTILTRLAVIPGQRPEDRWWHLPADLQDAWFTQSTAERRDPESGCWEKVTSGARNEVPDMAAYAWAIAHLPTTLRLGTRTERDWARDESVLRPAHGDLFAAQSVVLPGAAATPAVATMPVPRGTPPRRPPPTQPSSGFGKADWSL